MQEFIKSSLDYIEQNLKTSITADELAQMARYSAGHYCRLFSQAMGSSVVAYILKRRLDHALAEISLGRKAIDVVLEYGFDTYAGFYKAFVRMYGCSPKKYLSIYKHKKSEVFIMQSEKDLRKILESWDISAGLKIEDVSEHDWKIWKIGGYELKTNERSKMIRNIKIAQALNKHEISSHFLPIPMKSGEDYIDGENIFILTQIKGAPLDAGLKKFEEKYALKYGQGLVKLHRAFKEVQEDVKPDEINIYKQVIEWAMPEAKKYNKKYDMGISEGFFNDYTENFGKLYDKLPRQFIHRNPHGGNILFKDGEFTSVIGFEYYNECNVRLFDILYSAGELNTQPFDIYLKWLTGILKGYDSVSPLSDEEKQSIWYVTAAIGMIFVAYLDEPQEVARRNREALVLIAQSKEKFMNLL